MRGGGAAVFEFFAAEFEGFFADLGGAFEEVEAAIVLGEAFAGDLDALDIEFEFFVALDVAGEEGEVLVGGVGRGGAGEELAFEGGGDGGVEDGIIFSIVVGVGDSFGGFELVGGEFGVALGFEALEGGDVGLDAEAVGSGLGDFFDDFGDGHFEEPVVELVELFGGEGG